MSFHVLIQWNHLKFVAWGARYFRVRKKYCIPTCLSFIQQQQQLLELVCRLELPLYYKSTMKWISKTPIRYSFPYLKRGRWNLHGIGFQHGWMRSMLVHKSPLSSNFKHRKRKDNVRVLYHDMWCPFIASLSCPEIKFQTSLVCLSFIQQQHLNWCVGWELPFRYN